jgi:hypothetical protein
MCQAEIHSPKAGYCITSQHNEQLILVGQSAHQPPVASYDTIPLCSSYLDDIANKSV